jgi:hypothetical protein
MNTKLVMMGLSIFMSTAGFIISRVENSSRTVRSIQKQLTIQSYQMDAILEKANNISSMCDQYRINFNIPPAPNTNAVHHYYIYENTGQLGSFVDSSGFIHISTNSVDAMKRVLTNRVRHYTNTLGDNDPI